MLTYDEFKEAMEQYGFLSKVILSDCPKKMVRFMTTDFRR